MDKNVPKVYDEEKKVGVLSGKAPTEWQGPRRKAPRYYAGLTYGRFRGRGSYGKSARRSTSLVKHKRPMVYPDTEHNKNGSLAGIRNKAARRLIRGAFKRQTSSVERGIKFARALKAQAVELVRQEPKHKGKSPSALSHIARKLLEAELSIHEPVWVPSKKEIRAMRTQKRKDKRAGKLDAIGQLVDKMNSGVNP